MKKGQNEESVKRGREITKKEWMNQHGCDKRGEEEWEGT